jgi:1-deoxy-D-xylulose-5-phosphate synthase
MSVNILESLDLPGGLRSLTTDQLEEVASALRNELIDSVADSGGHFASSLGATEISVALHHAFDTPADRLIWDVGHQAYIHKMLTGRRSALSSIRKKGGISGFLKRCESEYDAFGAGHAGTSVSAAVGMRVALDRIDPSRYVVAIIGDGSLTAGMAFEAMNHAGDLGLKNFIVVLNDNDMSISPNVGALSWLFSRAITSETGSIARSKFKELYQRGYVPELLYKAIDRAEEATQGFLASPSMLFEAFGFRYIGPVDGHSIPDLLQALNNAKMQDVPVIVHTRTVKGKGYEPAEEDPIKWHGVTPFNREQGKFLAASSSKPAPSYTQVFSDTFIELARTDEKIVSITAAMLGGTGLDKAQAVIPKQVFDVGICEQHAVTFAAGLACEGYRPVVAIYSTFLQRGFDQVVHDVCIQNLPVMFAMDRGGLVGNDGETHQGVFDISFLRCLPNIVIASPKDENEFRHLLYTGLQHAGPFALRYPRGNGAGVSIDHSFENLPIGRAEVLRNGSDVVMVGFGPIVQHALAAAEQLEQLGISTTVINARFAKPLDTALLLKHLPAHRLACTLEDHALKGGFGSAVLEMLNGEGVQLEQPLLTFGVPDHFVSHGTQAEQHAACGFDVRSIIEAVRDRMSLESGRHEPATGVSTAA